MLHRKTLKRQNDKLNFTRKENRELRLRTKNKRKTKLLKKLEDWLQGKDLNLRPPGYEPDELPLLYPALKVEVDGVRGFEPLNVRTKT